MSLAIFFDEVFYIDQNADVAQAVLLEHFRNGLEHYQKFGGRELRDPNAIFSASYYATANPDVVAAVDAGIINTVFDHYRFFGERENRAPSDEFDGFNATAYLRENLDVEAALIEGLFSSALQHFIMFGKTEGRATGTESPFVFNLTTGVDNFEGGLGPDIFIAEEGTLQATDQLSGGGGADLLSVDLGELNIDTVATALVTAQGIETLELTAQWYDDFNFSSFGDFKAIEMISGRTVDGRIIEITLADGQELKLTDISDGDKANSALSDGGIRLIQSDEAQSLTLGLSNCGLGYHSAISNENLFIDIAGINTSFLNLINDQKTYLVVENSGGNLTKLTVTGLGTLALLGIPRSLNTIDGSSLNGNLTVSSSNDNIFIHSGIGADIVRINGGSSVVETQDGGDNISVLGGSNHTISSGSGTDQITLTGGNTQVYAGSQADTVTVSDGVNSVYLQSGDDNITVSKGSNIVSGGQGNDAISISGGINTLAGGSGQDSVNITLGTNVINSGDDNDTMTFSGGTNTLDAGSGNDSVTLTGGVNHISMGQGDDKVRASGGASNIDIRSLDGGDGSDELEVISTGTVTLPAFVNFETVKITDTVHQSLNFSLSASLSGIVLNAGTTIDGSTITTTLGPGQSLTIDSITDGDTSAASVADGGILIAQDAALTTLDLTLDDVGPATSITNENVFIDIAGVGVSSATLTSGNDSFVVITNSGGSLTALELLGSGTMALGTLPTSITNVNGAAASANLTLTIGSGTNTIRGGTGNDAITLTGGTNDVQTGDGDDIISTPNNLVPGDRIDGGDGNDTFEVIHTGLATIPSVANLISIESISIQDTVHQSLDFSALTSITGIELDSGTTVNGATINTTLGAGQSLKLDSITDGDTAAASLADGGIKVIQPNSSTSLDLTLDDIGPAAASANQNVFIDIAGANVANLNITSANDSFVVLENSGASISTLNIEGSGTLSLIGVLPNSITTIDGGTSSTSLTVSTGTAGGTITVGSGNDVIVLGGGTNNVNSGNGSDTVTLSTGNDTVNTGSGSDTVTASSGTNNITTGASGDQITLSGGSNTVNSGASNDQLTISGGTNNINTESGNDQITISGGNNTLVTGNDNDTISASNGVNNINTGSGNDQITLTGGTNTVVTGNNNDTINVSGGNNDIDTDAGSDQVVLTGGTNDVNTGNSSDTVTLSGGTETVDMGSGNDTVVAGANLSTSDTVNGGDGTGDTLESTSALTDALTARLSNFEILEIKGGGGITHDITGLAGLTSLKASGALTGAIVVTDLAEAAEVDISAAIGNNLTINQINSAGGSDTLTVDFSGGTYTTGGSIIAPNIETVTLKTSNNNSSTKTLSEGTFANAGNITIEATSGHLTILNLTAVNIDTLDLSSSNRKVNITTGADIFAGAFTFSSGSRNDTLDLDGATLVAGSVFELGGRQDTLTLNSDAVATVVRTSVTDSDNAFSVRDDATTANTPGFTSGSDTFDYNGSLSHDSATSVIVASGATLQAAVAADADATVYVIQDANGDEDLELAINNFADSVTTGEADTLETEAVDTGLLSYTGLDSAFGSSDIVLIAIDSETNEDATLANNGGTAVYRFRNSDTSTVDTVLSSELELIGVFQDAALGTGDFV